MDTEVPTGYFVADNGEQIKAECYNCAYLLDEGSDYGPSYWVCDHLPGVDNLKNFPFKNGCKHHEPNSVFLVDWDKIALEEENRRAEIMPWDEQK